MNIVEVRYTIDGNYTLYIDGKERGTYKHPSRACEKAAKYLKSQGR